jgi:hypothetical protein
LVEYGMLVDLIAVICVVAVTTLGAEVSTAFSGGRWIRTLGPRVMDDDLGRQVPALIAVFELAGTAVRPVLRLRGGDAVPPRALLRIATGRRPQSGPIPRIHNRGRSRSRSSSPHPRSAKPSAPGASAAAIDTPADPRQLELPLTGGGKRGDARPRRRYPGRCQPTQERSYARCAFPCYRIRSLARRAEFRTSRKIKRKRDSTLS